MQSESNHTRSLPKFIIYFVFLNAVMVGCGKVPETYYYTIDLPIQQSQADRTASIFPVAVGVAKFESGLLYLDDRIIYRQSPFEIRHWNYRRWVAPPHLLVTDSFREYLKSQKVFADIVTYPSMVQVKYVFVGKVKAFEEWDQDGKWFGKVAFEVTLNDMTADRPIWQKTYEKMEEADKQLPISVVAAISQALHACLENAARDLQNDLASTLVE